MRYGRESGEASAKRTMSRRQRRRRRFLIGYVTVVTGSLVALTLLLLIHMKMTGVGGPAEPPMPADGSVVLDQKEAEKKETEKKESDSSGENREQQKEGQASSGLAYTGQEVDSEETFGPESYAAKCGLEQVDKPADRTMSAVLQRLKELGMENPLIDKIYKSRLTYPDKMLEALANNPEMADFVSGYTKYVSEASGGITEDEMTRRFPLFLQWDPRWGYVNYGNGSCIGLSGCGPTCLSMALFYLTGDESLTPDKIAAYSMKNGHYVPGKGTAWALLTDLPAHYGVSVGEPEATEKGLKSALDQGKIVICSVGPGEFTAMGHFVVIYGYDKEGFKINDPNCVARSTRRWAFKEFADQIKHTWVFGTE